MFPVGSHEHPTVRAVGLLSQAPLVFLRFSLSCDGASDKRRLQKLLILEVKLMSVLGAEGLTNEAKVRGNVFPGPYRDSVQRASNRGTARGVSAI